ncbi:MAG TPA: hypothetical protein VH879_08105 [Gemmatimonadales bacterium]|jgi:hypothetical protein
MTSHGPTPETPRDEATEALVQLLIGAIDRTYATDGMPGLLSRLQDMFRRLDRATLTAMVYEQGLATEPSRENEPEDRR